MKLSLDNSCYFPPCKPTSPFLISVPYFFFYISFFSFLPFHLLPLLLYFPVRFSLSEMPPAHKSILYYFTQGESFVEMLLFLNNLFLGALFPFVRISTFFFKLCISRSFCMLYGVSLLITEGFVWGDMDVQYLLVNCLTAPDMFVFNQFKLTQ